MIKRIKAFFEEIYLKHKDKTVLVVCHGGVKLTLLKYLEKHSENFLKKWDKPKNASVSEILIKENKNHELIMFNCTNHL
ncbi:histidine phosphatase family protein [Candidatus Woesearchaeota archaeon]|nr:histidine phosphatase family protein [Candidatus Woesearchaeota archaeon]